MTDELCACGCLEKVTRGNRFVRGHNAKLEHPMLGKKHSQETLKLLSETHQGPRPWRKGKCLSEEARKKMSESHKGVPLSDTHRKNIGISQIGRIGPMLGKISPMKGRTHTAEANSANSEKHKQWWKDSENARKCLVFNSPNKQEVKLMKLLELMYPGEWKFVGDGQVIIDGKCPDFININGQKKIIELYGERWHLNDDPQDRINTFKPFGYDTLVIWVKQLNNLQIVTPILESFCGGT